MMDNPLVSILVVTYNSSKYVEETLESVFSQTYNNLELIVTDDCSKDETNELVTNWIKGHKKRFVRCEHSSSKLNMGIPQNINRGLALCTGTWIRPIAGDDLLCEDCVEKNIEYAMAHKDAMIIASMSQSFYVSSDKDIYLDIYPIPENRVKFNLDEQGQLTELLKANFISSTAYFYKKELWNQVKYDETYKYLEDYPFFLHVLQHGYKFHFLPCVTAKYRIAENSLMHDNNLFPQRLMEMNSLFFYKELKPLMESKALFSSIRSSQRTLLLFDLAIFIFRNKRNPATGFLLHCINAFLKIFQ